MPPLPLRLRDAEDRHEPAVVDRGTRALEDAAVALDQDRPRPLRERVARRSVDLLRDQEPATLEPGDRGTHGLLVDPHDGHQLDERADAQPATGLARVEAVDRDDQGARLSASRQARVLVVEQVGHGQESTSMQRA